MSAVVAASPARPGGAGDRVPAWRRQALLQIPPAHQKPGLPRNHSHSHLRDKQPSQGSMCLSRVWDPPPAARQSWGWGWQPTHHEVLGTRLLSWSMNRMGRYCTVFPSWILGQERSSHRGSCIREDRSPRRLGLPHRPLPQPRPSGFWSLAGAGTRVPKGRVEGPVRLTPSELPLENARGWAPALSGTPFRTQRRMRGGRMRPPQGPGAVKT